LAELTVAIAVLGILFAMTAPMVVTLFNVTSYVDGSYLNEDQLLPISTNFQDLIRGVVSPAPTPTAAMNPTDAGQPVPAFGIYGNLPSGGIISQVGPPLITTISGSSVTFFSNVGGAGPARVVAQLTGTYPDQTFRVTVADAVPGTCPQSVMSNAVCTWGTAKPLVTVQNVVNELATQPVFTYYLQGSGLVANPAVTFATCTASSCPATQILDIGVDLKVNAHPAKASQADDQTVVYELSTSSQAFDPAVG